MSSAKHDLEELLREVAREHHQAYRETDGVHDDWAIWYAERLQVPINRLLGTRLSKSEIIYRLVKLSKEQPEAAPEEPWPSYYARDLLDHYGH